jgi:hypothetical protein
MKRSLLLALLLATALGTAQRPRVTRVALEAMEKTFDQRVLRFDLNDPFDLLGSTRGVYLEGYGAVFTAEVNLVASAVITPFRPAPDREQIERLRQKKQERVALLKKHMREMLLNLAASLEAVPPSEQIALGVSVFYFSWEDRSGLPSQILMQARRQTLLDLAGQRASDRTLGDSIRVEEF